MGGVLFVGCDFSEVRTGMITIKASDRRILSVFNGCVMPTRGVMGVDFCLIVMIISIRYIAYLGVSSSMIIL